MGLRIPRLVRPALLLCGLLLAACGTREAPAPVPIDDEAVGHFCGMLLVNHPGPKAQIWIAGRNRPLWFASVADGFAYLAAGEREGRVLAVYVQDMGRAASWEDPGRDAWIRAEDAFYVEGSDRRGGMGAPELVPFADRAAAEAFRARHGGRIIRFADARALPLLGTVPVPHDQRPGAGS
ncbi:MAG: NosL protein [Rhodothalassiaceae bacterium]|nr:MAG: NosL protein [Rhodothalassiaceae bacterium]